MTIEIGPNLASAATIIMWAMVAALPLWPDTGVIAMWLKRPLPEPHDD